MGGASDLNVPKGERWGAGVQCHVRVSCEGLSRSLLQVT